MGSLFLFILSRTPTSAALNGAVTFMHAALESWLRPPLDLSQVLRQGKGGDITIVLFNTPANDGHFSPLLGSRNGTLRLPLADGGKMAECTFIARWPDPDILRQCVIVGAAPRR
jgi:hypothetical protein